jgi:hypothetical protein
MIALTLSFSALHADEISTDSNTVAGSYAEHALRENIWEVQIESGALFDLDDHDRVTRTIALPQMISLNWNLDNISNDDVCWGWFRGNTQWKFTAMANPLVVGSETYFAGFAVGPQYNFVQPGWNLVPFISARVGFGFTDSNSPPWGVFPGGQGQDFCFDFMVTAGARYFVSDRLSFAGEVNFQHISNAGLSEPHHNNHGYNLFGPQLSLIYAFN